jgi:hypothetical protein
VDKKKNPGAVGALFRDLYNNPHAEEIGVMRVGRDKSSKDYWLGVCAFLLEVPMDPKRKVVLLVNNYALESKWVCQTFREKVVKATYLHHKDGRWHGDFIAAAFYK